MAPRPRRRRTQSAKPTDAIEGLKSMVDALLKERRTLQRQIEKLTAKGLTAPSRGRRSDPVATGLAKMKRTLERALSDAAGSPRARRASSATATTRRRAGASAAARPRKPASPETQAKRLAALAKAREARAAKKVSAEES